MNNPDNQETTEPIYCSKGHDEVMRLSLQSQNSDAGNILWRLREITNKAYEAKHPQGMTYKPGWAWEMVQFIQHTVEENKKFRALIIELALMALKSGETSQGERMRINHILGDIQYADMKPLQAD